MLIDTHCHLEKFYRQGGVEKVLAQAKAAGVGHMIAIGTTPEDWGLYEKLASEAISYSVGLHPCYVEENFEDALLQIMPYFAGEKLPVALGEIGLDYFHLPKEVEKREQMIDWQKEAFQKQLQFAFQLECPVVIHSRDAFEDCVQMIDESGVNWGKVVFHCFVEGVEEIKRINERGGRGSFTGIITYKKAEEVRQALIAQGIEKLMLETDTPYLAPDPYRGKENVPAYMEFIAQAAADLLGMSYQELCQRTTENARKFFGIKS